MNYAGQCHCGAVRFRIECEPFARGLRCNCSICVRKGAMMSTAYFGPSQMTLNAAPGALSKYVWGDRMVTSYFCKTCGVYTFHETTEKPGHYRVNLGCIEGIDPLALPYDLVDGRSFPLASS